MTDNVDKQEWKYDPMTGRSLKNPDDISPWEKYCYERGYFHALEVVRGKPHGGWQGLTDQEIGGIIEQSEITLKNYCSEDKQTEYARAIEAKLREKNSERV